MKRTYSLLSNTSPNSVNQPQNDDNYGLNEWLLSLKSKNLIREDLLPFWKEYYNKLESQQIKAKSKTREYQQNVFDILETEKKNFPLDNKSLTNLQKEIENLTMNFDERSIYKTAPNIMNKLISDKQNAKEFLKNKLKEPEDINLLNEFGPYTIEALMVHVLALVFNHVESEAMVRVSTLLDQLNSNVRTQGLLLRHRRISLKDKKGDDHTINVSGTQSSNKMRKNDKSIGSFLIEYLISIKIIKITGDYHSSKKVEKKKTSKGTSYYLNKSLFAYCNFDLSLLPIQLNLPMISKPLEWSRINNAKTISVCHLNGGYLTGENNIYQRYMLIRSNDLVHFYINISTEAGHSPDELCSIMNTLQMEPYQINKKFLNALKEYEKDFINQGLLMPPFLGSINISEAESLLRELHIKDDEIKNKINYSDLLRILSKDIQRARFEQFLIRLATAYADYTLYFPAFLDFRGRIYRCGLIHFHERDIARSLLLFGKKDNMISSDENNYNKDINSEQLVSIAFHYKNFSTLMDASDWFLNFCKQILNRTLEPDFHFIKEVLNNSNFVDIVLHAKQPFQFLSKAFGFIIHDSHYITHMPITQDASASAYQIMSYLLLDHEIAKKTNLIQCGDRIHDIYISMLEDIKKFLKHEVDNTEIDRNLKKVVISNLNRSIVKAIFMPIIYGKTILSTANDLIEYFSYNITRKESFKLAAVFFKFFRIKFSGMDSLIKLIRNISWIASASQNPVVYSTPYYTTVQDYMMMDQIYISVYDRIQKKRRRVALRVSSDKRDKRKTETSTFANFIHQKDAQIAMTVVMEMLKHNNRIYTVHDNFITINEHSQKMPYYYGAAFQQMEEPLFIINKFIYFNIVDPAMILINGWGASHAPREIDKFCKKILISERLEYYLRILTPQNANKQVQSAWSNKCSTIINSYKLYSRRVCGASTDDNKDGKLTDDNKDGKLTWMGHINQTNNFKKNLIKDVNKPYFCVHY